MLHPALHTRPGSALSACQELKFLGSAVAAVPAVPRPAWLHPVPRPVTTGLSLCSPPIGPGRSADLSPSYTIGCHLSPGSCSV